MAFKIESKNVCLSKAELVCLVVIYIFTFNFKRLYFILTTKQTQQHVASVSPSDSQFKSYYKSLFTAHDNNIRFVDIVPYD